MLPAWVPVAWVSACACLPHRKAPPSQPMSGYPALKVTELFGLRPVGATLRQAQRVFLGDKRLPPSRLGLSSTGLFTPRLSLATWAGRRAAQRTVPILNLFNHTQTPVEAGWSVRITQVRDFRGRGLTYDSHNGTDLVVPPATVVVAAASGTVVAQRQEWNRGGLKLYVHHDHGLMTTYNHLGRVLVTVGQQVEAGQPVALSAYSGADGFLTFPWVAPHVHFNVALGGVLVDPFGLPGETPLWLHGNAPMTQSAARPRVAPATLRPDLVDRLLASLVDQDTRQRFARIDDVTHRGFELLIEALTYPTLFAVPDAGRVLYPSPPPRVPLLQLPLRAEDFDGVAFCDDLGFR